MANIIDCKSCGGTFITMGKSICNDCLTKEGLRKSCRFCHVLFNAEKQHFKWCQKCDSKIKIARVIFDDGRWKIPKGIAMVYPDGNFEIFKRDWKDPQNKYVKKRYSQGQDIFHFIN